MKRSLLPGAVMLALPWILGAGCDLFATRDPDVSEGTESLWQPPTSAIIVVENLRLAFQAGNFTDYRRALTGDFVFVADAADVAQIELERPGEATFDGWTADVESQTAETIRSGAEILQLDLSKFDEDVETTGRLLKYNYVLTITPSSGIPAVYRGEAWFRVRNTGGEWLIFEWEDVDSSTESDSWGLLKGLSRSRG